MITNLGTGTRRCQDVVNGTVRLQKRRTGALEAKEQLTKTNKQSALRMSKLLGDVSADFKKYMYHFTIVEQLEKEMK